jgi:hypothetical protein
MEIDDSHSRHEIENELRALEDRLTAWRPASGALDRDRMLYDAGRSAARTESHVQAWRVATAALLLLVIGSAGLLTREWLVLAHEHELLAQERAQRLALEMTLAAQNRQAPMEVLPRSPEPQAAEPFAPTSYFVLASRHALEGANPAWPPADTPAVERRRESGLSDKLPASKPLRPRNFDSSLEL